MNKKNLYFLVLLFLFLLGIGLIIISIRPTIENFNIKPINVVLPSINPSNLPENFEISKVVRVVDGDTIELIDGRKVRYIGINAPETIVNPIKQTACFSEEAAIKNKELVENKEVFLEMDISEVDKYGRLLRYVWINDSSDQKIMVNQIMVTEGFAEVATYPPDIKYQGEFLKAQIEARKNQKGLWNKCFSSPFSDASVSGSIMRTKTAGNSGIIN